MCVATSVVLDYRKNSGHNKNPGIMGQVSAEVNNGDLKVSYVSKAEVAHTTAGNLELQVIGEHVEASTHRGNISCRRAGQGAGTGRPIPRRGQARSGKNRRSRSQKN